MIQCSVCGFSVNELMKFALMNNSCPSCGGALFSNKDNNLINMIQSRIAGERFASKLTEELIYDLSLFFFNELKHGIGKSLREELRSEDVDIEYEEGDEDLIRKEVERELGDQLSQLTDDGEVMSDEVAAKAERLRRLREQQLMVNPNLGQEVPLKKGGNKQGPRVSRAN